MERPIFPEIQNRRSFTPRNDVDVFSNCLGFVGIPEGNKVVGYNVLVGGGLGMTHGKTATFQGLRM